MPCPLCDHTDARPSWLGSTYYQGQEFPYVQCLRCDSLYCDPMPDEKTLAQMYGPQYEESFAADPADDGSSKEPLRVVGWLSKVKPGTFIDYGCGAGWLLPEAAKLNWQPVGIEFDEEVARAVGNRTGVKVVSRALELEALPRADILHLGDVLEHLTEMNRQVPEILMLIKPGGLLIAQGPLENNTSLFIVVLRLMRSRWRSRRTEMAPYHVMLATAKGQEMLFRRFGLEEVEFSISEVPWPAPARLTASAMRQPRAVGLFALRRLSRAVSALRRGRWGNRYFYVGRWNG